MIASRHTNRARPSVAKVAKPQIWIVEFIQNGGIKFLYGRTQADAALMLEHLGRFWLRHNRDWIDVAEVTTHFVGKLHHAIADAQSAKAPLVCEPKPRPFVVGAKSGDTYIEVPHIDAGFIVKRAKRQLDPQFNNVIYDGDFGVYDNNRVGC